MKKITPLKLFYNPSRKTNGNYSILFYRIALHVFSY